MNQVIAAAPTQQDVFKSISDNVGGSTDPMVFYVVGLIAVGLVLLLVVVNSLKKRSSLPRPVNHQGRLMREVLKRLPLRRRELKQLKALAAEQGCTSPLTFVLCPSLLAKGLGESGRADKRVLMGVAKKMGILKKREVRSEK
jgi:hypothetical protein